MNVASFGKNTLFYAIGIIVIRFTTFLLIPLYTNYLTIEEYGLLATLLFTTEIIITINDIGMRSAFMRFFADYVNKNKLGELIGTSTLLNILVGFFLIAIALFIPDSIISDFFEIKLIEHVVILTVLVGIAKTLSLNILSYFRAKNLGGAYMVVSIVASLILVVVTWLALVEYNLGIIGVLYSQILTFGSVWLVIIIWVHIKEGLTANIISLKKLYVFGYPLIIATAGTILVNTFGNYFLGFFRNLEEVALFSIAYKISTISVMVLIAPFQLAYEPYVFNNKNNPNLKSIISKIVTYISIAYLIVSVGIIIIFKFLIKFIGNSDYSDSYPMIFLLLPAFLFTAYNYVGQSLIHLNNKTKTTGITSLTVAIFSIVISYFATKHFGTYGTIFGVNFYLIVSGIALVYLGNKEFPIKIDYKRIIIVFSLGVFLFIAMYNFSLLNDVMFFSFSTLLTILTSVIVYRSNFLENEEKKAISKGIIGLMKLLKVKS